MLPDDIIIRRATKPEIIKYYLGWYKFKHFLLSFRGRRKEKLLEKEALQRLVDAYLVQTAPPALVNRFLSLPQPSLIVNPLANLPSPPSARSWPYRRKFPKGS